MRARRPLLLTRASTRGGWRSVPNSSLTQWVAGAVLLLLGYLWLGPGPSFQRDQEPGKWLQLNKHGRVVVEGHTLPSFTAEVLGGLDEGEAFTFFAPSDRAIERLQRQLQTTVGEEDAQDMLSDVLLHHVVAARRLLVADLPPHGGVVRVKSVAGFPLALNRQKLSMRVDDNRVHKADLILGNGVVHLIDKPLIPKKVLMRLNAKKETASEPSPPPTQADPAQDHAAADSAGSAADGQDSVEDAQADNQEVQGSGEEQGDGEADDGAGGAGRVKPRTHLKRRKRSEMARLHEEAAAQLEREKRRVEEEEARKALAGLNELLHQKKEDQPPVAPARPQRTTREEQSEQEVESDASGLAELETSGGDGKEDREEDRQGLVGREEADTSSETEGVGAVEGEQDVSEMKGDSDAAEEIGGEEGAAAGINAALVGVEDGVKKESDSMESVGAEDQTRDTQTGTEHDQRLQDNLGGDFEQQRVFESGDSQSQLQGGVSAGNMIVHKLYDDVAGDILAAQKPAVCSGHGTMTVKEEDSDVRVCMCAAMYEGEACETARQVPGSPHFKGAFNHSIVFSRLRLSQEALKLADAASTTIAIETPTETLPLVEELTAHQFKSLWAELPRKPILGGQTYKSCALVGFSGVLLRSERGEEMDAHDMVLRLGRSPTRGYEAHVGMRTTLRLLPSDSAGFHEGRERAVYEVHSQEQLQDLVQFKRQFPDEHLHFLSPEFLTFAAASAGSYPSLEYIAINIAMQVCSRVDVYGFFAAERQGARYHYFDKEKAPPNPVSKAEWAQTKALAAAGLVHLQDPCMSECHQSLATCSKCLGVSVPDLFQQNELSLDQEKANQDRNARWETFLELRRKYARRMEAKRAAEEEARLHPYGGHAMARTKRLEREKEKAKHTITYDNNVEVDVLAGWEYLIETGSIEELNEAQLRDYFIKNGLENIPSTKLEMVMDIKRHNAEVKRRVYQISDVARGIEQS